MATKTQQQADYNGVQTVNDNETGTGQLRVDIVSNAGAGGTSPTTGTQTSVAASATSVTLLALNAARKSASIFNDADKALFVKFGTTASATSFKIKIAAGGYWDFPQPIYTGRVDGIWEAAPTGSARISEET